MKGTIKTIERKSWTNPQGNVVPFAEVHVEEDGRLFTFWGAGIEQKMIGDEIEFDITEKQPGKFTGKLVGASKPPGSPMRGKSPEELKQMARTMSMSYAKDLCVALINKEVLSLNTLETHLIGFANKIHSWVEK
jgi:hypothetical protein